MKAEELKAYRGKRVLITGASGFIGRHLVKSLAAADALVFAAVRSKAGSEPASSAGSAAQFLELDVTANDQVLACLAEVRPEVIFNLAGITGQDATFDGLAEQWSAIADGAIQLALTANRQEHPLFVQIGSSSEYGDGPTPFSEEQPDRPISAYAAAKTAATRFLLAAHKTTGLQVIVARPTVVYGPGQTGDMLLPHLIKHYLEKRAPMLTAGDQTRDFLFIDDLVAGLLQLGLRKELSGRIVNLSSGLAVPVKNVVETVAGLCGYDGDLGLGRLAYPPYEVMVHRSSFAFISKEAGWRPLINLDEGLKRTIKWWLSANSEVAGEGAKG